MMSISRYIISLCLCIGVTGNLLAQASRWLPSGLRVGTDAGALGYLVLSKQKDFFEITADTDFNNLYLVADYGYANYQLQEPTYSYTGRGSYLRLGVDINIMKQDQDQNIIFFGARYAAATFNDKLEYQTGAVLQTAERNQWPSTEELSTNNSAGSRWFELNAGIKMRVFAQFYMGFTARYKILKKDSRDGTLRSYYVPGFGKNIDSNTWGLNYYIYYRLPFRKKETPEKQE